MNGFHECGRCCRVGLLRCEIVRRRSRAGRSLPGIPRSPGLWPVCDRQRQRDVAVAERRTLVCRSTTGTVAVAAGSITICVATAGGPTGGLHSVWRFRVGSGHWGCNYSSRHGHPIRRCGGRAARLPSRANPGGCCSLSSAGASTAGTAGTTGAASGGGGGGGIAVSQAGGAIGR
jgi:hypothetical protein